MKTFHAQFLLHKLHRDILSGQKIDKELQTTKEISARLLKKYYRMVTLFTGGHIKYGFLIGYVLSGKKVPYKKTVTSIGEDIGVLRQIDDDIKDYEGYHHEALGDLINHKKRLPELLFQLQASTQQK